MTDYDELLDTLISELDKFINGRYISEGSAEEDGGFLAPKRIEDGSIKLYAAVQALESYYGSQMPMGAWEHWNELLHVCRRSGDDARRGRDAYVAADRLLKWAKGERNDSADGTSGVEESAFLGLTLDPEEWIIRRKAHEAVARFGREKRAYDLVRALLRAKDKGQTRGQLMKEIFKGQPVIPNNLDQQKGKAMKILKAIGVTIRSPERSVWKLEEL